MSNVPYNHKAIEKKWRERWEQNPVNLKADERGISGKSTTVWTCSHIRREMAFM